MRFLLLALAGASLLLGSPAMAEDLYFSVPISGVELTEGSLPGKDRRQFIGGARRFLSEPRLVLDGPGEGCLARPPSTPDGVLWHRSYSPSGSRLLVRAPAGADVTGRIVLPAKRGAAPRILRFRLPAAAASAEAREEVLAARESWFGHLVWVGAPGRAWFRHRTMELRRERLGAAAPPANPVVGPQRGEELEETLRLFSGGRAIAENLRMERILRPVGDDGGSVPIGDLAGITVEEVDWGPLLEGKDPELDRLAANVPADQYAVFFRSLRGLVRLVDEARAAGAPVLSLLESRSADARTWERTQRQLCLSLEGLNRFLGPLLVRSVVVTGSDPFLRTGSDVAVLFETDGDALFLYLALRHFAIRRANPDVRTELGLRGRQVFYGLWTPDRRISSWVMRIPDVGLVVTNSRIQIEALAAVVGGAPAMAGSPEYRFFRDRYPRSDRDETALLVVPDAAIRAWGGPRARILSSRRIRAVAALTMLQARHLAGLATGALPVGPLDVDVAVPDAGRFLVEPGPVGRQLRSEVYGTLDFLTPIAELPLETVTRAEADAYERFRSAYQSSWRQSFDPLAIRFSLRARSMELDLSVFPLIRGSEYRDLIELTEGTTMQPTAGDPHAGALLRFGMSIDHSSSLFREIGGFLTSALPGVTGGALSWLGDSLTFYLDDDPFWDELVASEDLGDFLEATLHRIPVALYVEVSGAVETAAFLASLRGFVEQTAPGLLLWENRTLEGKTWVRIAPADPTNKELPGNLAIHYAVTGERLLITLDEELMKRALVRDGGGAGAPWLGRQVGLQADGRALDLLDRYDHGQARNAVVRAAWAALPILNEWKRLFPDRDPVALHEALWGVRLRDPAGGTYVWDAEWKTMSSEAYGHPAAPKPGPGLRRGPLARVLDANLGLSFELGGLRARARITRSLP